MRHRERFYLCGLAKASHRYMCSSVLPSIITPNRRTFAALRKDAELMLAKDLLRRPRLIYLDYFSAMVEERCSAKMANDGCTQTKRIQLMAPLAEAQSTTGP